MRFRGECEREHHLSLLPTEARRQFDIASAPFLPQLEGLEVRVVFKELNGENVLLGGQARYFDQTPETLELPGPYPSLTLAQALIPRDSCTAFLDSLFSGKVVAAGHEVRIAMLQPGDPTIQFIEQSIERDFRDEEEHRFGVSWFAAHSDDLFGRQPMVMLERDLRSSPGAHNDLKDLFNSFTPSLESGRGHPIKFDLRVPVLVKGNLRRVGKSHKLVVSCGTRVDIKKLNVTYRSWTSRFGSARGLRSTKIQPQGLSWTKQAQVQVGVADLESPEGTTASEVMVGYQGFAFTIPEKDESAWTIDAQLMQSAQAGATVRKIARWKNIVHGEKYPFAFLDLDAADSKLMLEEDESRARPALEKLQETFDLVVNAHEGNPFWGGGDGAVGYFVGAGMERLALLAAIKILLLTEAQFLDSHSTASHLKLRAGLNIGVSEWKENPGKNISADLSATGHIQKHDKSAPRLTVAAEFVKILPPELRALLLPSGKSDGKEVFIWNGLRPAEVAGTESTAPGPARLSPDGVSGAVGTALNVAPWPSQSCPIEIRRLDRFPLRISGGSSGADFLMGVSIGVHNTDTQALAIDEVRIKGELKSVNGSTVALDRHVYRIERLVRIAPAHTLTWPDNLPCPVPANAPIWVSLAFELTALEVQRLGGPSARVTLRANLECEDTLGRKAIAEIELANE